jgi:hypothetical protein
MKFSKSYVAVAALVLMPFSVLAMNIQWGGNYRFEYVELDKPTLASPSGKKAYFLNHLSLSPKIIAADGINLVGRFEVFPSSQYPDSQVGGVLGGTSSESANGNTGSAVANGRKTSSSLEVNQLYATIQQEYGSILVGRAPLEFGLGITHNAGDGLFDHWYDVRDLIGYKFHIGNLSIMPVIAKVIKESNALGTEGQDMIWNVEYNNEETASRFGLFHQTRNVVLEANDSWKTFGSSPASITGGYNVQSVSILLGRAWPSFEFQIEAGFLSGGTGVTGAAGDEVRLNGYGIALELEFPREASKWDWKLRAGVASGDNPTSDNFEGFAFDRNYNLGFLLFNHPLGQYDLLNTRPFRNRDVTSSCASANTCPTYSVSSAADEEAISNAIYVSPVLDYVLNDQWTLTNTLVWAQMQTLPTSIQDTSKDLGLEWDLGFNYKFTDSMIWANELGLFFPGGAFKEGSSGRSNDFTYGFQSRFAITF